MRVIRIVIAVVLLVVLAGVAFLYLAPETALKAFVSVERERSGVERREVYLASGLRFVYLEGGKGEPLMLLHGFGADKDTFTRVARYLTPRYRVIIPDEIGFGESSHPLDADYSSRMQAERLHALVRALGVTNLHLGGNSMGGQIAMAYAAQYPSEVRSLWLLDPAGIWSAPKSDLSRVAETTGHNPLMPRNAGEMAKTLAFVMNDPPSIPRPILEALVKQHSKYYALEQSISRQIVSDSMEAKVAGLATPSLIVWGKADRVINPDTAEILHGLLPRSRVILMPGVGHVPISVLLQPYPSGENDDGRP